MARPGSQYEAAHIATLAAAEQAATEAALDRALALPDDAYAEREPGAPSWVSDPYESEDPAGDARATELEGALS